MNKSRASLVNKQHTIFVSVLGKDISYDTGINVRAKNIFKLLSNHFNSKLVARGNSRVAFNNIIIITPATTKIWNIKLISIIIGNKFDCVYCIGDLFGFITYYLFSKIYKYNVIFDATGVYSHIKKSMIKRWLYKILEKFVIEKSDYVTCISKYVYNYYIRYNKNMSVLPIFTNCNSINYEITKKYFERKDIRVLGMIGPFDSSSNTFYQQFLEKRLKELDKKIIIKMIGTYTNKIKSNKVLYTGYIKSFKKYIYELASLDAVLIPHKPDDPGPYTKIIESMLCGLTVFTTPKGTFGLDHLNAGKNILVFMEDEIVSKINELIFNDELMKSIGENAKMTIKKHYSLQKNETRLLRILNEVLKN